MYRSKTCGELRIANVGEKVTLAGWVQRLRKMGAMTFVDLRDRYGITQIVFNNEVNEALCDAANGLGREYVIQLTGTVAERSSKNANLPTGEIEIIAEELNVLNKSEVPPFTIEDNSDGGDDLRMQYRYLDLRRNAVRKNLELRSKICFELRRYLNDNNFLEVETPILTKSTPEGARDFVVPSRMNPGQFYALPQSPQLYKQLLMVGGFDRYFQIAKCFRDEDLRADRQPEFTQIDCEMSFVDQEDVLNLFEGLVKHIFKATRGLEFTEPFPRMPWADAMKYYGSDKPDIRFGMKFVELKDLTEGHDFAVFDSAEYVGGICCEGCASYTRKQIDALTDFVKRPQIGAKGLVWIKVEADGSIKSSIGKFYSEEDLKKMTDRCGAKAGDMVLVLCGKTAQTRKQLNELRLEMGNQLGLRDKDTFAPLWVVDFPMFEWDEETQRYYAMHHPFTMPNKEDIALLKTDTGAVRAYAYDMVMNGVELGGGSIRIHEPELQNLMFELLGFTPERANEKFGFLMSAFKYGAPPHAGLAFGLDRFVSMIAGLDSIRDTIAFPKNNSGRDMMNDSPAEIEPEQLDELFIKLDEEKLAAKK
ncbi:MAG: aspartate--tRNA ligase [Muribaculaceae bacterium]|jgi:aspartyl-tRNA synthetase|nr:aspartate--tRNA ligase [Muribaculaceae bacterium]MEE1338018.1 aspartate--tRNA ligase [Muribaculaceae bacterium]